MLPHFTQLFWIWFLFGGGHGIGMTYLLWVLLSIVFNEVLHSILLLKFHAFLRQELWFVSDWRFWNQRESITMRIVFWLIVMMISLNLHLHTTITLQGEEGTTGAVSTMNLEIHGPWELRLTMQALLANIIHISTGLQLLNIMKRRRNHIQSGKLLCSVLKSHGGMRGMTFSACF